MTLAALALSDLPAMKLLEQHWQVPDPVDIQESIDHAWDQMQIDFHLPKGASVAIAVGSRGIANLPQVVARVVQKLRAIGCRPFITPAMGSHGGATIEGQIEVLAALGITEASIGGPIRATMEVVSMGEADGIPLFLDRYAHEADGIVLINRIKQHTTFSAPTESGLIKMLAIGLGNQHGATHYHRLTMVRDYGEVIRTAGRELIKRSKVLFGLGLVENQNHEISAVYLAPAASLEDIETRALEQARSLLPMLPLDDIDLLIVDQIGKDISGEGMDPNVTGREACSCGMPRHSPVIHRIMVRDVTPGSEGNVFGVGNADFTVKRLVDKMDSEVTSINCLTSCCPEAGKIPISYPNDRIAFAAALMTLRPYTMQDLRLVHIKNTLELKTMLVSEACWTELATNPLISLSKNLVPWRFDDQDDLISPLLDL